MLTDGYARDADEGSRVGSTVGLARDGDVLAVIDPGMVVARSAILLPLAALGVRPESVTDVVLSHHHPDHTMNVALFPNARVHDHWAWYRDDLWVDRPAEGFALAPGIRLIATPGHTKQDVTTLVETEEGVVAFTHLWWSSAGPVEVDGQMDLTDDVAAVHANRQRVLSIPGLVRIVPGHGPAFAPGAETPR